MSFDVTGQESYVQNLLYGWSWTGNSGHTANITYTFDVNQLELNDDYSFPAANETAIDGSSLQQAFANAVTVWARFANISISQNNTPSAHHIVFGYADLPASQTDENGNRVFWHKPPKRCIIENYYSTTAAYDQEASYAGLEWRFPFPPAMMS